MRQCPDRTCLGADSVYVHAYNFCPVCRKELVLAPACPACNRPLSNPRTPFCGGCGAELGPAKGQTLDDDQVARYKQELSEQGTKSLEEIREKYDIR